jgi:hypothetical protein
MAVSRPRAALAVLVAVVGLLIADVSTGAPRAHALDGAVLAAEITYRVDPDRPAIEVETTYRMTNVSPDRDLGGGRFEYYFFTGLIAPIDEGASDIAVRVNSRDGAFSVETDEFGFPYLDIDLGYELRYQKTATVVVTYTLFGDEPRTDDTLVRANPAYVSFPVTGWADPGLVDVQVRLPGDWDATYVGSDLTRAVEDGVHVFEASEIENPDEFWVYFTARNDEQLDRTTITVDDHDFELASWPGDTAWLEFVSRRIRDGFPVLEDLIGADWPVDDTTTVTQAATAQLDGYGGFYDSLNDLIEISEYLDLHLLLHELTHAWINGSLIDDRFLSEGLADEIAARAHERIIGERPDLVEDDEVLNEFPDFDPFLLLDWPPAFSIDLDDSTDDYGYAASRRVIQIVWDEIGDERMRELLAAVVERRRAYQGPDDDATYIGLIGWKEFLDLAEEIGGATTLDELYDELVLDSAARRAIEPRADTIAAYDELQRVGGTWETPDWISRSMARWQFDRAVERIDEAAETLSVRDLLVSELDELELVVPDGPEEAYESVLGDGLGDVRAELDALFEAAVELAAARAELDDQLTALELDVPALTQAAYVADPYGIVDDTEALVDDAEALAAMAGRLDALLESSGLDVPALEADAFVDDRRSATELLSRQVLATQAVIDTESARDGVDSWVEGIGLIGNDIDDDLAALTAELAAGDLDEVFELSDDLNEEIDELDDVGRRRVTFAASGLGVLLLASVVSIMWWRRRRWARRTADDDAPADTDGLPAPDAPVPLANVGDDEVAGDAATEADAGEAGADDPGRG